MKIKVQGKVKSKYGDISIRLEVIQYDEDGCKMLYCPALDVIGYGHSEEEAEHSFSITLQQFLDYTLENGTLHQVLSGLGWKIGKEVTPPLMSDMIPKNDSLREIVDGMPYTKAYSEISLPALA